MQSKRSKLLMLQLVAGLVGALYRFPLLAGKLLDAARGRKALGGPGKN
jgi:hypothetical protein